MEGYCKNGHTLYKERDGEGIGCVHWDCEDHVRYSWTGEHPTPPNMYSAKVDRVGEVPDAV